MKLSAAILLVAAAATVSAAPPPYRYDEIGYDFEGGANDVGAVPGKDLDACYTTLTSNVGKNLKATAVTFYQGTCYLKKVRGAFKVNAAVNSTVAYPDDPALYVVPVPNFDVVGNDLKSVPNSDLAKCLDLCKAYPGCRAYSWTNDNGGTCYLKQKGTGFVVVPKQGVTSGAAYPDQLNAVVQLEENIDYVDHDIGNKPSAKAEGCVPICRATPGCHAFTWSNWNDQGTCWLKAKVDQKAAKSGVYSSVVKGIWKVYKDKTAAFNNEIITPTPKATASAADCQVKCVADTNCQAFVWDGDLAANMQICHLFKDKPAAGSDVTDAPKKVSGAIDVIPAECTTVVANTDLPGGDIGNRAGIANANDCPLLCQDTDGCNAYTWSNYMGGTCWLKSYAAGSVPAGFPNVGVTGCKKLTTPF